MQPNGTFNLASNRAQAQQRASMLIVGAYTLPPSQATTYNELNV